MALDCTSHDQDSDPNELELNLDVYEGLADKVVNEVAIDLIQCLNIGVVLSAEIWPSWSCGRKRCNCHGPLTLHLTWVLHRPFPIHEVKTRKGQALQGEAKRALRGRKRREPLWQEQSNPTKVTSRNK